MTTEFATHEKRRHYNSAQSAPWRPRGPHWRPHDAGVPIEGLAVSVEAGSADVLADYHDDVNCNCCVRMMNQMTGTAARLTRTDNDSATQSEIASP